MLINIDEKLIYTVIEAKKYLLPIQLERERERSKNVRLHRDLLSSSSASLAPCSSPEATSWALDQVSVASLFACVLAPAPDAQLQRATFLLALVRKSQWQCNYRRTSFISLGTASVGPKLC